MCNPELIGRRVVIETLVLKRPDRWMSVVVARENVALGSPQGDGPGDVAVRCQVVA
jgi:hypothetical protein